MEAANDDTIFQHLLRLMVTDAGHEQLPAIYAQDSADDETVTDSGADTQMTKRKCARTSKNRSRERMVEELKTLRAESKELEMSKCKLERRNRELRSAYEHGREDESWQLTAVGQFDKRKQSERDNRYLRQAVEAQQRLLESLGAFLPPDVYNGLLANQDNGLVSRKCLSRREEVALTSFMAQVHKTYDRVRSSLPFISTQEHKRQKTEFHGNTLHVEIADTCGLGYTIDRCATAVWDTTMADIGARDCFSWMKLEDEVEVLRRRSRYRPIAEDEVAVFKTFKDETQDGRKRFFMIWEGYVTGAFALEGMTAREAWIYMLVEDSSGSTHFSYVVELHVNDEWGGCGRGLGTDGDQALMESCEKYMDRMMGRMKASLEYNTVSSHHPPPYWLFCRQGQDALA